MSRVKEYLGEYGLDHLLENHDVSVRHHPVDPIVE